MLKKLYEPRESPMNIAAFMSGSGTNAVKLLEYQKELERKDKSPFRITLIVTDNREEGNNAWKIAERFGLGDVLYSDFKEFKRLYIKNPKDFSERQPYFKSVVDKLMSTNPKVDCIALAGYEIIVTEPLLSTFADRIINVHPADLSIRDEVGRAIHIGNNAVRDTILSGQTEIRSSTHIVIGGVDQGPVLLISEPVRVVLPEGVTLEDLKKKENLELTKDIAKKHQNELKKIGDWQIFPLTLELMARGAFAKNDNGVVHFNSQPIPIGLRVDNFKTYS
jgi:folate-dependent phosphoribosylglycinamide formyltransferase PurN